VPNASRRRSPVDAGFRLIAAPTAQQRSRSRPHRRSASRGSDGAAHARTGAPASRTRSSSGTVRRCRWRLLLTWLLSHPSLAGRSLSLAGTAGPRILLQGIMGEGGEGNGNRTGAAVHDPPSIQAADRCRSGAARNATGLRALGSQQCPWKPTRRFCSGSLMRS
jgi:hypothetical protein